MSQKHLGLPINRQILQNISHRLPNIRLKPDLDCLSRFFSKTEYFLWQIIGFFISNKTTEIYNQSTFSILSVPFCAATFSTPVFSKTSSSLLLSFLLAYFCISISFNRPCPLSFVIRLVERLNFRIFFLAYHCSFLYFS